MAATQLAPRLSPPLPDRVMDAHVAGAPQSSEYPAVGVSSTLDTRAADNYSTTSVSPYRSISHQRDPIQNTNNIEARMDIKYSQFGIISSQHSDASPSSSGPPRLAATSSNVSANTDPETRQTSPVSSINRELIRAGVRPITPQSELNGRHRVGSDDTSPASITTADSVAHGTKRTASGACKVAMTTECKTAIDGVQPQKQHVRHRSLDSRIGKVGNLTAQLKTRLSYAMVKVQNGWEKSSIDEIEENLSRNASPTVNSPPNADSLNVRYSPAVEPRSAQSRATGSEGYLIDGMRNEEPRNGNRDSSYRDGDASRSYEALPSHVSLTRALNVRPQDNSSSVLAPSPSIVSRRSSKRQQPSSNDATNMISSRIATANSSSNTTVTMNATMATPSTPLHNATFSPSFLSPTSRQQYQTNSPHRISALRMPSHQAEKDAIDTLVLLRSPRSATFAKNGSGLGYGQGHDRMGGMNETSGTAGAGIGVSGTSTSSTVLSSPMVMDFAGQGQGAGNLNDVSTHMSP